MRHHDRVRMEFSQQALPYSQTPSISDAGRLQKLVTAVSPDPNARVLDVACGPGYVALAFAEVCREVVGIDLTPEMLEVADTHRRKSDLTNDKLDAGGRQVSFAPMGLGNFQHLRRKINADDFAA